MGVPDEKSSTCAVTVDVDDGGFVADVGGLDRGKLFSFLDAVSSLDKGRLEVWALEMDGGVAGVVAVKGKDNLDAVAE